MDSLIMAELATIKQLICDLGINNKEILNLREACTYLGVSESFLYKKTWSKKIPHYKPNGKLIFFRRSELDSWVLANRITTNNDVEMKATDYVNRNQRRTYGR